MPVDPGGTMVELPDPGPRPGYPQAHLWRPLSLEQWQVEIVADGRLGLDVGAELEPSDVVFGASLGVFDGLQTSVMLDLRANPEPMWSELDFLPYPELRPKYFQKSRPDRIAYALEMDATYAVFTSGTGNLSIAGSIWLWITLREDPALVLAPTVFGVWRIVDMLGIRAALSVPVRLQALQPEYMTVDIPGGLSMPVRFECAPKDPDTGEDLGPCESTVLMFVVRPEFQPFDWLWLSVGVGVGARGSEDVIVPMDFELGITPWGPIDVFADFAFPDLQSLGADKRTITVGLRGRI